MRNNSISGPNHEERLFLGNLTPLEKPSKMTDPKRHHTVATHSCQQQSVSVVAAARVPQWRDLER